MLATKLDDSSLISRSHMVKKENQLLHVILQVCCGMCSPTHAPTQNKCSKRRKKKSGWTSTTQTCTYAATPATTTTTQTLLFLTLTGWGDYIRPCPLSPFVAYSIKCQRELHMSHTSQDTPFFSPKPTTTTDEC